MGGKTEILAIEGHAETWEDAIRLCGDRLIESGNAGPHFVQACIDREREYPTGLPAGIPVAIPHGDADDIVRDTVCFLRTDAPVRFQRMDDSDEHCDPRLIFNIAVRPGENHLAFLQHLMTLVLDEELLASCLELPLEEIPAYLGTHLR